MHVADSEGKNQILMTLTLVYAPPCENPLAPRPPDVYLACESD
jgi:hypothetical protein